MAVGINLTDDIRVELGEIKELLLNDLTSAGIKYEIPFDKLNKEGIKETIIHIKEIGTEISIENDIISYIKLGNTPYTKLDTIDDITTNVLVHIKNIQKHIEDKFGNNNYTVKIEKIDTVNMNITLIVSSDKDKCRIQILRDNTGGVYINTIRSI